MHNYDCVHFSEPVSCTRIWSRTELSMVTQAYRTLSDFSVICCSVGIWHIRSILQCSCEQKEKGDRQTSRATVASQTEDSWHRWHGGHGQFVFLLSNSHSSSDSSNFASVFGN